MELYRRCDQLSLDRFIRCIVDSDLKALIISGEPTSEELAVTWGELYYEYIELSAGSETTYLFHLERDITLLSDEVFNVETALYFLSPVMLAYCEDKRHELVSILHSYGYKQPLDFNSDYTSALNAIQSRLAPKKIKLETKQKELAQYLKSIEGGTITREYFSAWLMRLGKMQGYKIIPKETTVTEFLLLIKEYNHQRQAEAARKEDTWQ